MAARQSAAASSTRHHTYTTNFALTENPISEGSKWTNGQKDGLDWANVRTSSGLAFGTEPGGRRPAPQEYDDSTALLTGSWGPDQTAEATVRAVKPDDTVNEEVELRLRSTLSPHRATGYEILFRALRGENAYCEIVRWNGPLGDFTYVGRAKGPHCGVEDGSVVKATAIGNQITAYINGVKVVEARDDTYKSGSPGIGFFHYGSTGANRDYGFTSFTASDQWTARPTPGSRGRAPPRKVNYMEISRRNYLRCAILAGGAACLARGERLLQALPLGLPAGVQLWSVREQLKAAPDATLRKLAEIGYREVELFETPKSPREFRKRVEDAGLKCVSGHFELKDMKDPSTVAVAHELGLSYMILVFPALPSLANKSVDANFEQFVPLYEKISLSDYKWNAEQLNRTAENLKRHGIRAGYHNHAIDFKNLGGTRGFDTLIQNTDPNLVCFEMDCGHVIHAGYDPIAYLNRYPSRIELLHVKDLVPGYHVSTTLDTEDKDTNAEIGHGSIDWKKLFATAARYGHVRHYFVEHEGKMAHPPLEALQISYDYLQRL